MLTGTPLDLTVIPELLRWAGVAVPVVWLGVLLAALVLAWARTRTRLRRTVTIAAVLLVLLVLPGWGLNYLRRQALAQQAQAEAAQQEFLERRAVAEALFQKRCETAGEFIYKTVPDVKGVVWMKWRLSPVKFSRDQFDDVDFYGADCEEEGCIEQLLRSTFVTPNTDMNKPLLPVNGYEFVETTDPRDGRAYRYTAGVSATGKRTSRDRAIAAKNNNGVDPGEYVFGFGIRREPVPGLSPRFGIAWEALYTREDREHWITGGSLTVTDLQTGEVIAKRIGYMMDVGLGSKEGFRDPWGFAFYNSCPKVPPRSDTDTRPLFRYDEKRAFLFKVLQPTQR